MEVDDLPDLSDWRFVEIWTLEEAAMLWAAIDPMEHLGKRLSELSVRIHPAQYKKALLFLRAAKEAVCAGTLPFTDAWEDHMDEQGNFWSNKIEFPKLPDPARIAAEMTRVQQAAFVKWAQSKSIPSYRKTLTQARKPQEQMVVQTKEKHETLQEEVLLLAKPSPLDITHPCHPAELKAGIEVWETVVSTGAHEGAKSVKAALRDVLDSHPEYSQLSNEAKIRVSTTANWKKEGGATKTPTKVDPTTPSK